MGHATITQKVDCIFGHDHTITVEVNSDNTLGNVTTSCSADKEETQGLILLGTDPMKTCLGYMDCFIKHATHEVSYTSYGRTAPKQYMGTMLYLAAGPIANEIQNKKNQRRRLQDAISAKEAAKKEESLVCRRLREIMAKWIVIGPANQGFSILQEEDGHYTFNVAMDARYDYRTQTTKPGKHYPIADRRDGVWVVREDWEHGGSIYNRTGSWGGTCVTCGGHGNRDHDETKGHRKTLVKKAFIAMQATSAAGMKLIKKYEALETDGARAAEPLEFKYRANQKQFLGVRLPQGVKPRPSN
jgi:hypothetical protein